MFVAVDPGKHSGVATFNDDGTDKNRGKFYETEFLIFLQGLVELNRNQKLKLTFIVEAYWLRQDKALEQTGSDMPAPRMIGAIQMVAKITNSEVHFVSPANLKTALKWAGMNKYLSYSHVPDEIAAYSHGVMWLVKNEHRKHRIFDEV